MLLFKRHSLAQARRACLFLFGAFSFLLVAESSRSIVSAGVGEEFNCFYFLPSSQGDQSINNAQEATRKCMVN